MKQNISSMKKIILPFAAAALLFTTSCTKENLSRLDDIVNNAGDDHGGGSGSGKGENIAASSVPDTVMNDFNAKYPGASVREWKKLENGNYKVEFDFNGDSWESTFTASGELVKEERD
jgi:hypothetical protein